MNWKWNAARNSQDLSHASSCKAGSLKVPSLPEQGHLLENKGSAVESMCVCVWGGAFLIESIAMVDLNGAQDT